MASRPLLGDVVDREGYAPTQPGGVIVDFDLALRGLLDHVFENDMAEALAKRHLDRRAAALGPEQMQLWLLSGRHIPTDCHIAAGRGPGAVLGRVGGKLVQGQA